jgi:dTDP-4-dehydrorhamnose 3,5-epimerase
MGVINPVETRIVEAGGLGLDDFDHDRPWRLDPQSIEPQRRQDLIDGVTATALTPHSDPRGSLCELLTTREGPIDPIVHVYMVSAAPGSVRAWVYHRFQRDRLAFANGDFEVVLYDLRPGSRTRNHLNVFRLGDAQPCLLELPPLVIHAVKNAGATWAHFINMPTCVYDPEAPDKSRIPENDPRIPYSFA